jgi:hypothetical protein
MKEAGELNKVIYEILGGEMPWVLGGRHAI